MSAGSEIENIDDVETVVVREGSSFEDLVRERYPDKTIVYGGAFGAGGMVSSGEADGFVTQLSSALDGDQILVIAEVLEEDFYTAFPINPRLPTLKADVDIALADMIADGTYADIYERWFDDDVLRVDR